MRSLMVLAVMTSGACVGDGPPSAPDGDVTPPDQQALLAAELFCDAMRAGRLEEASAAADLPWCYYDRLLPPDRKGFEEFLAGEGEGLTNLLHSCPEVVEVVAWPIYRARHRGTPGLTSLAAVLDDGGFVVRVGRGRSSCDAVLVVFRYGSPRIVGISH